MILLFGILPDQLLDEVSLNSKGVIQNAANALQGCFIEGLGSLYEDVQILNFPYVSSFPLMYKAIHFPSCELKIPLQSGKIVRGKSFSFSTIVFLKDFIKEQKAFYHLKRILNSKEDETIVIYACYPPFLEACRRIKKIFPKTKVILIVPDLPQFMSAKMDLTQIIKKRYYRSGKVFDAIDGFVLLSKYMCDLLPINNKPWVVIEGMYKEAYDQTVEYHNKKVIMYSGTLAERYGIMNLVNAFKLEILSGYQLVICGTGGCADTISNLSKTYKNIVYLGQRERSEVLDLQRHASLLVNPRTPEGEFTKYSFPSKVMEYFASSVPTMMYRLPGIPDEYYNYCYTLDEISPESIANTICKVLSQSDELLKEKGKAARNFILQKKSPRIQCSQFVQLLSEIRINGSGIMK